MKLKRGIGVLLCCLTVMGMFSVSGMSAEAAQCRHTNLIVGYDAVKDLWVNDEAHFFERGTKYECVNCGYCRLENLHIDKEPHTWVTAGNETKCTKCGRTK